MDLGQHKEIGVLEMALAEGRRHRNLVPLAALINREMRSEKMEKPTVRYGCAAQSRKGEDYFLMKTDCQRILGNSSSTFSVFAVMYTLIISTMNAMTYINLGLLPEFDFSES